MTICAFTASRVRRASVLRGMPYSPSLLLLAKPRSCDASKSCCDASLLAKRDARFFDGRDEHQPRQAPCRWRGQYPDGAGHQRCPTLKQTFLHETPLYDHLVGAGEPCRWGLETYALARWSPYNLKNQPEQEMHVAAVGSAFRRLGSIGSPHLAQVPYVPSDIRFRAASI
jgi:hypothetical protein